MTFQEKNLSDLWTLIENAPVCIHELDTKGRILYMNPAGVKMARGNHVDEFVGHVYFDSLHPSDEKRVRQLFKRSLKGETIEFEFSAIFKSELRHFHSNFTPVKSKQGKIIKIMGYSQDITEQKRSRNALQQANTFLDSIVENNPNIIFVKDAKDLRYVSLNKAHEKLHGVDRKKVLGKTDSEIFPKNEAKFHIQKDKEVLKTGKILDIPQEPLQTENKGSRILHTKKVPIFDANGQPEYLLGISEDITDKRNLEEQLRQSQKMEAIGKLVGGIAHDFNNIMTGILGYTNVFLKDLKENHPMREGLSEIKKEGEHAASLIRQLLAFGRKQVLKPEILVLNDLLKQSEKMFHRITGEGTSLALDLAPKLGRIKCDPGQLNQVLINLVINARDAMPEGGKLTISTENVKLSKEQVRALPQLQAGSYVMLVVRDTGVGMTHDILPRIFDPFFTTKKQGQGTGLGLSTVFGIVKQSGGHIDVKSKIGKGTTFKIYFPRCSEKTLVNNHRKTKSSKRGSGTILIVEDKDIVRNMAKFVLQRGGYKILDTNNPTDAVTLCRTHPKPIDLLLTDVVMPDMNGLQLAEKVRQLRPEIKVMYMSGYAEDFVNQLGLTKDAMNFIQKPVTPESLMDRINLMMESKVSLN